MSYYGGSSSIEASGDVLLRQAHSTADVYLSEAIESIDKRLGKGYAAKHPELVAAFMQTAARDLHTAIVAKEISNALYHVAGAIASVKDDANDDVTA